MGLKTYTVVASGRNWMVVKWAALANTDTGVPFDAPHYTDKSIQVLGTFGSGGKCTVEGTNMPATPTYATLNDPQGNILEITTAKIEAILENVYQIRPNIVAGDGTTALDVYLLVTTTR